MGGSSGESVKVIGWLSERGESSRGTLRDVAGVLLCNLCPPTTLSFNMSRTAARATILVEPLTGKDMWAQIRHGAYFLKNRFYCIGLMKYYHFPMC